MSLEDIKTRNIEIKNSFTDIDFETPDGTQVTKK